MRSKFDLQAYHNLTNTKLIKLVKINTHTNPMDF